jgi:hypothetical protein
MGVNLNPSADIAVVSDRKAALSVQDHIGADPAMLPDFDITKNQDIVITRRTFAKSILSCDLPAISQQITDRHVALELFPHLAAQLCKQLDDSVSDSHSAFRLSNERIAVKPKHSDQAVLALVLKVFRQGIYISALCGHFDV